MDSMDWVWFESCHLLREDLSSWFCRNRRYKIDLLRTLRNRAKQRLQMELDEDDYRNRIEMELNKINQVLKFNE